MRDALSGIDGQLVLYRSRPLSGLLDAARAQERFAALLMTTFAVLALSLSLVGSYGVLAGTVARRRREIGIRMALGAEPGRVRRTVLGSAVRLTSLGIGLGLVLAWFGSRWLELLLFDVGRDDPLLYVAVGVGILIAGTVVGWLPAHRATRVDPASALAAE